MNRRERRRQGITEKPKVLTFTGEQLNQELEKVRKKVKEETILNTTRLVLSVMALSLQSQYDFTEEQINNLIGRINYQIECIQTKDLTKDDISIWCKENNINIT